jgi:hypothetical protein
MKHMQILMILLLSFQILICDEGFIQKEKNFDLNSPDVTDVKFDSEKSLPSTHQCGPEKNTSNSMVFKECTPEVGKYCCSLTSDRNSYPLCITDDKEMNHEDGVNSAETRLFIFFENNYGIKRNSYNTKLYCLFGTYSYIPSDSKKALPSTHQCGPEKGTSNSMKDKECTAGKDKFCCAVKDSSRIDNKDSYPICITDDKEITFNDGSNVKGEPSTYVQNTYELGAKSSIDCKYFKDSPTPTPTPTTNKKALPSIHQCGPEKSTSNTMKDKECTNSNGKFCCAVKDESRMNNVDSYPVCISDDIEVKDGSVEKATNYVKDNYELGNKYSLQCSYGYVTTATITKKPLPSIHQCGPEKDTTNSMKDKHCSPSVNKFCCAVKDQARNNKESYPICITDDKEVKDVSKLISNDIVSKYVEDTYSLGNGYLIECDFGFPTSISTYISVSVLLLYLVFALLLF